MDTAPVMAVTERVMGSVTEVTAVMVDIMARNCMIAKQHSQLP